jgi:hypothetical protein
MKSFIFLSVFVGLLVSGSFAALAWKFSGDAVFCTAMCVVSVVMLLVYGFLVYVIATDN